MSNHLPTLIEALISYCDYFFPYGNYPSADCQLMN